MNCHSSSVFSFLAFEAFHRELSRLSVNCSRKGALRVVGYCHCQPLATFPSTTTILTVNVGRSTAEEVTDSTTDSTELDASLAADSTSSTTSALAMAA